MRPKRYETKADKQAAYRARKAGDVVKAAVLEKTPDEIAWDENKYPVRGAWDIAVERAERARKYAAMFPDKIAPSDLEFQTVDWQYHNEGLKAVSG
jgi:hypothetical protein